jgi:AraC-like DNA-binding protein
MTQAAIEQLLMPHTYVNYLARAFDDHVRLTAGTPLLPDQIEDYAHPIAVQHVLTCVKNALAMAPSPDWHLPWAKGMAEHFHGPVTMALVSAPTLGHGLDTLVRFMPKRVPYHHWRCGVERGVYYCELLELIDFGPVRAIVVEIPILVMHEYVHTIRGGQIDGAHVELRYAPTNYLDSYARYFNCPVVFEAERNAFVLPASWLETKNAGFEHSAWQAAIRRCEQTSAVPREQDTLTRVRREIFSSIEAGTGSASPPTLKSIASRLHVSPRTLIRHLREADTTYQAVVDDIQKGRAKDLLANHDYRIYDVANELGYRDPASFGRSFKRWFGMTPGAYRSALGIERR